jgi:hypothetical protein
MHAGWVALAGVAVVSRSRRWSRRRRGSSPAGRLLAELPALLTAQPLERLDRDLDAPARPLVAPDPGHHPVHQHHRRDPACLPEDAVLEAPIDQRPLRPDPATYTSNPPNRRAGARGEAACIPAMSSASARRGSPRRPPRRAGRRRPPARARPRLLPRLVRLSGAPRQPAGPLGPEGTRRYRTATFDFRVIQGRALSRSPWSCSSPGVSRAPAPKLCRQAFPEASRAWDSQRCEQSEHCRQIVRAW